MHLIVTQAFGARAVGDRITEADDVARIEAGEERLFVVRIATPPAEYALEAPAPVRAPSAPETKAEPAEVAEPAVAAAEADAAHG